MIDNLEKRCTLILHHVAFQLNSYKIRTSVTFVEFASNSFALKFLKWCIFQQIHIRKHSYSDDSYLGGLAITL